MSGVSTLPTIIPVSTAFILGLCLGEAFGSPWWCVAIPLLLVLFPRGRSGSSHSLRMLLAVVVIGNSWGAYRLHHTAPDDAIQFSGFDAEPLLVKVSGRVFNVDSTGAGGSKISLESTHLVHPTGQHIRCTGRFSCRIGPSVPIEEGSSIEVTGWLFPPGSTRVTEGEPDWVAIARHGGFRGRLVVPDDSLVRTLHPDGASDHLHLLRGRLRSWCSDVITTDIGCDRARMLLLAISVGVQPPYWNKVASGFRRVGVAHLLAISGMHLGILLGFVAVVLRQAGCPNRLHGFALLATTLLYLLIVAWRPPILRAALMAVLISIGMCRRRFPSALGLLGSAALLLSAIDPGTIFLPGFQLSFIIVLYLVTGTSMVRRRWFGTGGGSADSVRSMVIEGIRTAFVVSVIAWFASIPIVIHHFGTFSPYSVPASLILIPMVSILLAGSFLRVVSAPCGLDGIVPGWVLEALAGCILRIVHWFDLLPASCIRVDGVPFLFIPIGLALVAVWIRFGLRESCWTLGHIAVRVVRRSDRAAHTARSGQ